MRYIKRVMMALLALVILVGGAGASAQPAQAAGCWSYHTVRYGESLSWIGRYYNVSWPYLAQVNGIGGPRFTVFPGQVLCIPGYGYNYYVGNQGGYPVGGYPGNVRTWSFQVVDVNPKTTVTIRTYNTPSNIRLNVRIGAFMGSNHYDWIELGDLDTASGGSQTYILNIPAQYANANPMKLRLSQYKKNGKVFQQDQVFYNAVSYSGPSGGNPPPGWVYYPPYYTGTIPTIWIMSVVRDNTVTIQTHNFPPGLVFDVLMGPIGTRGIGGIPVGTLNSGAGGTLVVTYSIPPQLYGHRQIAIRTQNYPTGFFSYNWFYNNTTY